MEKKSKLGKGLGALIKPATDKNYISCDISDIVPNKNQPRKSFDEEKLQELAESIKQYGIIQPIVVKKDGNKYIIVAGERRYRAAKMIGLKKLSVILFRGEEDYQVALIENLQREDLNPIEVAEAYAELIKRYKYTQHQLSEKVGKSRPEISNCMRLLNLSGKIKDYVRSGELTVGQARPLSVLEKDEQEELFERIFATKMTAREVERLAAGKKKNPKATKNKLYRKIEEDVSSVLPANVKISKKNSKIAITFEFKKVEDFDNFIDEIKNR